MKKFAKVFGIVFFWSSLLFLFGVAGGVDAGTITRGRALLYIGLAFIGLVKSIDILNWSCK